MGTDYRSMWTGLGLDLEAHDALLTVLTRAYQDIYLSQRSRPKTMGYFDFVMSEVHGLRIETDYSMEDVGQLKTRIEAFVEQLG